jgi:hypothetical protein
MGADEDDRPGEIGVEHAGHGDQELTVKEAAFAYRMQHVFRHDDDSLSIRDEMKSASTWRSPKFAPTQATPCPCSRLADQAIMIAAAYRDRWRPTAKRDTALA